MNSSILRRGNPMQYFFLILLILIGVALTMSQQSVQAANNLAVVTLTDEMGDWTKVNGYSTGWSFDSSNPASFDNDTTRIKRNLNNNQSIRYYQANGFTTISVKVYYYGTVTNKFKLFRSTDAVNWTAVNTSNTTGVATSGGWYRTTFTPSAANLPANTKYLMLELSNDANAWAPQIAQVVLSYNNGTAATATRTSTPVAPVATATPAPTSTGGFTENFDALSPNFHKADGWTNGSMFNAGWRADHVTFASGLMTITVDNATCPSGCSAKPYAAGEYRTNNFYRYGRYEVRMKPAKYSGAMTGALFTYTGPSDGKPWDEIDVEFLGNNLNILQTNYFTNGVGGHETIVNLGFDASTAFHTYAFEWTASSIKWYVDGVLVVTENGSRGALPTNAGRIMLNAWPGTGVDGWLGTFNYTGPFQAQYDWVKFTPLP